MTTNIDGTIVELKKIIQLIQNAPRRVLLVQGGTYPSCPDIAQRLASELEARYVNHLTELLPSLSGFPLEAYKPRHLLSDLHRIVDKERRTVVIANLEPLLCIWAEADQQRFLLSVASSAHNNVLVLFCSLPLRCGFELSNQLRVYQVSQQG